MARLANALFTGSHTKRLDPKGRLPVPAEIRASLDADQKDGSEERNGFICAPSVAGPFLDCGGLDLLDVWQARLAQMDPFDPTREAFELAFMGQARTLTIDKEGRTILPKPFIEFAGLSGEVCFIGRGGYFQILPLEVAEKLVTDARALARDARMALREAPLQTSARPGAPTA
ncbi:MAG: division/cell wall cluster transcriptional repressor MraZ [Pseudomonadota bacterium]